MTFLESLHVTLLGPARPYRGGIAHHTALLARTLRKRHRVRFYSYSRQYPGWLYPGPGDREPGDAAAFDPEVRYTLDSLNPRTWLNTARDISSHKTDLFLVPWWTAYWAPQVGSVVRYVRTHTSSAIIFLCHNVCDHETSRMKSFLTKPVLRSGDALLCHSDEERDLLHNYFPGKLIQKIYHPSYGALIESRNMKSRNSGERPGAFPKLLFFGFIRPYKGLEVLLRALPEINRLTGAVLNVVGEPWGDMQDVQPLLKRYVESGLASCDLRYVPLNEIAAVFDAADLVVLPYHSATGCGVAQMAFGSGKPVVATDVGGLRDAVREGENGFLVRPGDEKGLTEAVVKALSPSVYPRLVEGACRVSGEFTWDGIVDILERIYLQLRPERTAKGRATVTG